MGFLFGRVLPISPMARKACKHCGESFVLLLGKPGYANECPTCLHEKTRPQIPLDVVAKFLKQHPERRRHLDRLRETLKDLGVALQVDDVIADLIVRSAAI